MGYGLTRGWRERRDARLDVRHSAMDATIITDATGNMEVSFKLDFEQVVSRTKAASNGHTRK